MQDLLEGAKKHLQGLNTSEEAKVSFNKAVENADQPRIALVSPAMRTKLWTDNAR